jgi:hypothetical protein
MCFLKENIALGITLPTNNSLDYTPMIGQEKLGGFGGVAHYSIE